MENFNLLELLEYINPTTLNYNDWLSIGMALKHEGYSVSDWDTWSRKDGRRYHPGECENKWNGFLGNGEPVTGATITVLAKQNGWKPKRIEGGHELDWGDRIQGELAVVDNTWLEGKEVTEPTSWQPEQQVIEYLETLFEAGENVGYVTESWDKEEKYLPTKGNWDRTAGQLIQELSKCNGDIGSVLGDYKPEAGAWIRFNPLDGNGCKNENVTDYRYALVESDTMDIAAQNALVRELELPVAILVHSGKKSLHAIVRVEAGDYKEYRKRVDYLYDVLKQNGMEVDTQNKNPSRLSRLPGIERNGPVYCR